MHFIEFCALLRGQNNIKHEQLVKTASFNASGWSFAKIYSRRILILNS
jgi:hypothetical protein